MMENVESRREFNALQQQMGQFYNNVWATYVPLTTALTNTGLDGDAVNIGTYIIGPTGDAGAAYTFAYPTTAKALAVRLGAQWAVPANANYADLRPNGGTGTIAGAFVRAHVANIINDSCGVVGLDSSARALLTVAGANTAWTEVYITGWFL